MSSYRRAIAYFRPDTGKIILNFVMIGFSTLLGLLWPFPLAILIDSILGRKDVDHWLYKLFFRITPENDPISQILVLGGAMLGLRLIAEILQFIRTLLNIRIGYNGLMRVRCDLFRKLQALSLAYHKSQPQGDAIYRVSYDSLGFQSLLNTVVGIAINAVTLIAMAGLMFSMNWKLTLLAMAVIPPLILTIRGYGKILSQRYKQSYEVDSQVTTAIQRSVASIGLVQAFGREQDEYQNFFHTMGNSIAVKLKLHWDEVMYWLILGVIFGVSAAGIFGYGGILVHRGALEVGQLTIFLFYLEKLYEPLKALSQSGAAFAGSMTQVDRVFEVLDRDPIIRDAPGAQPLPRQPRTLQLENVSFAYNAQSEPVLRGIDVTITPGQMVAFVGSSGVGKSTLLNLLPRFFDPTGGVMRFDGIDVRDVKVSDLRKHVALVLQDNMVLPTTVAENIAYGRPEATDADIQKAAKLAGAASFIEKLPKKYETEVNEAGANLSGGQRQRIGIARALLTEAPILVLDEPTSALDPQHEQMITETLIDLKRHRTIVLVSHRLSTVADCDQIFVMEAGKIIEKGTHEQLIAQRGLYFTMAKHQMKLTEDDPQISQITQMGEKA